jgi:endoglucanase
MLRFFLAGSLLFLLSACGGGGSRPAPAESNELVVRVSTVGYRPDRGKRATYAGRASTFEVRRADDDSVVFSGEAGPAIDAVDSGETLHEADFRDVTEPGEYYVKVRGVGRSPNFPIADDVYVEPFRAAMLGLYGQRCGTAVELTWHDDVFSHEACHLEDASPLGWHDAGDYGKYVNNGAMSLGVMLLAWEHFQPKLEALELDLPERGGDVPDFLDECRFQAEWLLTMQLEDGSVADRISVARFESVTTMPENATAPRPLAPPSTVATADFAAVLARTARAFEPYDAEFAERCRTAAVAAWDFLQGHPEVLPIQRMGFTGGYDNMTTADDLLWAAAEIWQTTGDEAALAAFEAQRKLGFPSEWDWWELQNLGYYTYLLSDRSGRDEAYVAQLTTTAVIRGQELLIRSSDHGYGRSLGTTYRWGANGTLARTVTGAVVAHRLSPNEDLLDVGAYQLDHLFGRNYFGRSFVTGVGLEPPAFPHHRPSAGDAVEAPWPGLLVGGPSEGTPISTQWFDETQDFSSNEVAINWNAALVYALAAYLP